MGSPCRHRVVLRQAAHLRAGLARTVRAVRQCRRHDPRHDHHDPVVPIPGAGREGAGTGMVGAGIGPPEDGGGSIGSSRTQPSTWPATARSCRCARESIGSNAHSMAAGASISCSLGAKVADPWGWAQRKNG